MEREMKKTSFEEGPYGVPDIMTNGLNTVRNQVIPVHPLEAAEKKFDLTQTQLDYSMLKNVQGIHAPLRLTMERQAAAKIQRLPFMPSSNLMLDTLLGNDDHIGIEDAFDHDSEKMVHPQLVMEKSLK